MAIQMRCPSCRRPLNVPSVLLGLDVKCPACDEAFQAALEESLAPDSEAPPRRRMSTAKEAYQARPADLTHGQSVRPDRSIEDEFLDDPRTGCRRDKIPHRAEIVLALGIMAFVGMSFITGIPAWVMGTIDLRKMRDGVMDSRGKSATNIGRVIGMVITIVHLPMWIALGIAMALSN